MAVQVPVSLLSLAVVVVLRVLLEVVEEEHQHYEEVEQVARFLGAMHLLWVEEVDLVY